MKLNSETQPIQIAVLGCGFMGTALLAGILEATQPDSGHVSKYIACVKTEASLERVKAKLSSHQNRVEFVCNDNVQATREAQVVILGFQPNELQQVLTVPGISESLSGKLIISLLAFKSCSEILDTIRLEGDTTSKFEITRVIPSIGAQINESMSLIAETPISAVNKDLVLWLFQQVGKVEFVPESLLNTATAISATCHALTLIAVDSIVDASVAEGITRSTALGIANQCFRSSASMLQRGMTLESFKESMSVPHGITINSILQLDRGNVRPGISDAVRTSVAYANKIG